jgi:hypothetical protein
MEGVCAVGGVFVQKTTSAFDLFIRLFGLREFAQPNGTAPMRNALAKAEQQAWSSQGCGTSLAIQ